MKLKYKITPDLLFFAGFIPYLIRLMWQTTMFGNPFKGRFGSVYLLACIGVLALKVICFDKLNFRQMVLSAILLGIGVMTYLKSKSTVMLMLMVMVIGARNINFDKILKAYLTIVIGGLVVAFVAAMLGIIEDIYSERYIFSICIKAHSFGIINTTDFAAHIFFASLVIFYLRRNRQQWFDYVFAVGGAIWLFFVTHARLDCGCMIIMALLFAIGDIAAKAEECSSFGKAFDFLHARLYPFVMPALTAGIFILSLVYSAENKIINLINNITSYRLSYAHIDFKRRSITLFGQHIKMYGWGRGKGVPETEGYTFIDISYQQVLLCYGVVSLAALLSIYVYMALKNKKNRHFLYCILLIAINCTIAHHLHELAYNPFTLAFWAYISIEHIKKESI